ncbi:MAG: hypothetical protein AAF667_08235 [Pseudomonadota bacterium]
MSGFRVESGEQGRLHAFALDPDAFGEEPTEQDVAMTFNGAVDEKYVFVADMAALKGIGLTGFMTEGLHARASDLAQHKDRLDNLSGHVAIILSEAFHGAGYSIPAPAALHFEGSFGEHRIATTADAPRSEAATGVVAAAPHGRVQAPRRSLMLVAVLLVTLGIIALMLLLFRATS